MIQGEILTVLAYGISLIADPCIILSASVAGNIGGRPLVWALILGFLHFCFGVIGISISDQLAAYSGALSHMIAAILVVVILLHLIRHSFKHSCHSCGEVHNNIQESLHIKSHSALALAALFSVAAHALGSGFVLGTASNLESSSAAVVILFFGSAFLALVIAAVLTKRSFLKSFVTKVATGAPGLAVAALGGLLIHLVSELFPQLLVTTYSNLLMILLAGLGGLIVQLRSNR